ncbi:ion channel [Arsenicibacter rosenii]|uniref:ion channel n=1 Tax=Arsenicibacter rosenii TaxID=1750698 RepID=UPI000B260AC2|nr:ion channel [Arsenicibacter rosenii]
MKKRIHSAENRKNRNLGGRASRLVEQEGNRQDLGFGTRADTTSRLLNKDGSFNVRHINQGFWNRLNIYPRLITMPWLPFLGWIFAAYMVANTFFALIYVGVGVDNMMGAENTQVSAFWSSFFFSAQTLTTVGYGHLAPRGFLMSSIAAFESMLGLLSFALATGLLYARFSRPTPHIRFSKVAVFAPYLDVNGWMFRIINERSNQLIDVEIEVSYSRMVTKPDGSRSRQYSILKLERNKVAFFPNNWTLVHAITPDSPMHDCTEEQLMDSDAEFLILLRAIDDTFSQMVHLRYSYRCDEVVWGAKFRPMFNGDTRTMVTVDLNKLDEYDLVPLN